MNRPSPRFPVSPPGSPRIARELVRYRSAGFSLLEVLVAFVILSIVVLGLYKLFSGALGNASASDEYSRALLVLESRIALVAVGAPLREGIDQGNENDGRYQWEVAVRPFVDPEAKPAEGLQPVAPYRLWTVDARVSWPGPAGGRRTVQATTWRAAPAQ